MKRRFTVIHGGSDGGAPAEPPRPPWRIELASCNECRYRTVRYFPREHGGEYDQPFDGCTVNGFQKCATCNPDGSCQKFAKPDDETMAFLRIAFALLGLVVVFGALVAFVILLATK